MWYFGGFLLLSPYMASPFFVCVCVYTLQEICLPLPTTVSGQFQFPFTPTSLVSCTHTPMAVLFFFPSPWPQTAHVKLFVLYLATLACLCDLVCVRVVYSMYILKVFFFFGRWGGVVCPL